MEPKSQNKRRLKLVVSVASVLAVLATVALPSASTASGSKRAVTGVLTMESSPENAITQNFNPYVESTGPYQMGADSLIYEPLLQFDLAKPSVAPYDFLATAYKWG